MNRFNRYFKKDKYGIVRGCVLQCLLLALAALVLMLAYRERVLLSCADDAASAVQHASTRMTQYIDDSIHHMESMAQQLDDETVTREELLGMLSGFEHLQNVSIVPADGIMADIVPAADGGLQLRVSLESGEELTAQLSQSAMHSILADAIDGNYDYTLYNLNTGACLLGNRDYSYTSFYDVLLNMNDYGKVRQMQPAGEGSASIFRADMSEGVRYVALAENTQAGCGIAFSIPEANLMRNRSALVPVIITGLVPMFLLMGCAVLFAWVSLRRIRNSNRNIAKALEMSERQVSIAARDSRITILVIGYGHEGILSCHDGLDITATGHVLRSLSDLETACGMAEGEMDRVYECLNKVTPGNADAVTVRCFTPSHESRSLRISFSTAESGGRNILCSISDCTHELDALHRAEEENSYLNGVKKRTSAIWQVNVSRNRWRSLQISQSDPLYDLVCSSKNAWRDFSADLSGILSECVHPADYYPFAEKLGIPGLASAFRSGMTELTLEHRIAMQHSREYAWHRLHARLWSDPKTNDIIANFYLYNVDAKKNAELERGERKRVLHQALMALSGIYTGLYYVDLDNDLCYTARSSSGDLADQLSVSYKKTVEEYLETEVHPDDREKLRGLLSAYQIKRSMTEGSHYRRLEYQGLLGDGTTSKMAILVQPARFENGTIKEIVVAIRDLENDSK